MAIRYTCVISMLCITYYSWVVSADRHKTPIKQRTLQTAHQRTQLLQSPVTDGPAWRVEEFNEVNDFKTLANSIDLRPCCWLQVACCSATFALCICCNKLCCCCCKKDCCDDR